MWLIEEVAEQRITEALKKGVFNNLPGAGKPLCLDDDSQVPESLRVGYRMLKNAGYLPPELQIRKEIAGLRQLMDTLEPNDRDSINVAQKRLNYLLAKLNMNGRNAATENAYYEKLQHSLSQHNVK